MALIRAALICLWMLALGALMLMILPLPRHRRAWLAIRLSQLSCSTLLRLLRVHVRSRTKSHAGREARLVVANHVSWIDVLVLCSREPLCFLAKREVAAWPLIGTIATSAGTIFIDRRRKRDIPGANRAMADRLALGRSVLLFPEGTTFDGRRRGRFRTSHLACLRDRMENDVTRKLAPTFRHHALAGRCAVQAVALAYDDPAAAWIGDAILLPHIWSILTRPPITCTLAYGERREVQPGFDRKHLGVVLAEDVERLLAAVPMPLRCAVPADGLSRPANAQNDSLEPTTASVLARTGRSTLSGT